MIKENGNNNANAIIVCSSKIAMGLGANQKTLGVNFEKKMLKIKKKKLKLKDTIFL